MNYFESQQMEGIIQFNSIYLLFCCCNATKLYILDVYKSNVGMIMDVKLK